MYGVVFAGSVVRVVLMVVVCWASASCLGRFLQWLNSSLCPIAKPQGMGRFLERLNSHLRPIVPSPRRMGRPLEWLNSSWHPIVPSPTAHGPTP